MKILINKRLYILVYKQTKTKVHNCHLYFVFILMPITFGLK